MILIVDSGSSKTDWCFATSRSEYITIQTDGINPAVQSQEEMTRIIHGQLIAATRLRGIDLYALGSVFFYGAGCTSELSLSVASILHGCLGDSVDVHVASDLLAAAHALCGHSEGIACILGTGSNSCLYDGEKITAHTPALGYILGDEGSGSALGKALLNGILKGWLPQKLGEDILEEARLNQADIIEKVYRRNAPNRFLASLSKYILPRIGIPEIEELVVGNFELFVKICLTPYKTAAPILNAIGSIAYYYKPQLCKAAERHGYTIGKIMKSPIEGLLDYYFCHSK